MYASEIHCKIKNVLSFNDTCRYTVLYYNHELNFDMIIKITSKLL